MIHLSREEYLKRAPKKRIASGILLFNQKGELLILKPIYKDVWSIPGGVVEENESPRQAAIREAKEETGLDILEVDFLSVEYSKKGADESMQLIFSGGELDEVQISNIKVAEGEISEYKFLPVEEALELLSVTQAARVKAGLKEKGVYFEGGSTGGKI